ncbi:MAG: hypothetical protein ABEK50_11130 [bacterium]
MEDPVPLPVISVDDAPGTALVMLPGVSMERLEQVSFEVDDNILHITCIYDEEQDQTFQYDVEITEENRETIESMERLAVMNPSDVEPRKLTSDPEQIKRLRSVMEDVKSLTEETDEGEQQNGLLENGQGEVE